VRFSDSTRTLPFALAMATECPRYLGVPAPCTAPQRAVWANYVLSFGPIVNRQPLSAKATINEVRLVSKSQGRLLWTVGGYWENRKDGATSQLNSVDPATGIVKFPYVTEYSRSLGVKLNQTAAFGEATFKATDRLSITGGARYYSYDKSTFTQVTKTSFLIPSVAGPPSFFKGSDTGWVSKVNVSFDVSRDLMLYAQRSEGFRPGGVNNAPGLPDGYVTYKPDSLVNYEVGAKSTLLDGRMTLNAAAYHIDWSDMQVVARIPNFGFITNIGSAKINGFELEGAARPITGLTVRGNLAYNHGELAQDQVNGIVTAPGRKGDRIPNEPDFTGALSIEYLHPVARQLARGVAR
jgi:outer membrane receptor protein involved in Fe transport